MTLGRRGSGMPGTAQRITQHIEPRGIAGAVGRAYAAQITSNPKQLMAVTVYSPKSLDITVPGVTVTKLSGRDSAYLYRYDGLRLLQASGGNYFLISQSWDASHRRVVVIPAASNFRVEFSR